MPEQSSKRANQVTSAGFEEPFETHLVRFGVGGLNLKDSLDAMEGWSRLTNVWHEHEHEATARPGQTAIATFPATVLARTRGVPTLSPQPGATRLAIPRGPHPSPRLLVNGWFPHVSTTGRIASGAGDIYVEGVWVDSGFYPRWVDDTHIVYNAGVGGVVTRLRDVDAGTYVDLMGPCNIYAADAGVWLGLVQAGPIYLHRWTDTTLVATVTDRGAPAVGPTGSYAWVGPYHSSTPTVYVNGAAVYTGAVQRVSLASTKVCVSVATGTYTRQTLMLPSTDCTIQSWEDPQILDGPGGATDPWICSLVQHGLILRPAGSTVGYYWEGENAFLNPWARCVDGIFVIAYSNGSGELGRIDQDPTDDGVDLITGVPAPGPGVPGGPDPGIPIPPGPSPSGTTCHSIRKLRDPQTGDVIRVWGVDDQLRLGLDGALDVVETGYSGDPLTLLPHRPTLSGDPWMFVADRTRMRKVRADGLVLPIGLPAPGSPPSAYLGAEYSRVIAMCERRRRHRTRPTGCPRPASTARAPPPARPTPRDRHRRRRSPAPRSTASRNPGTRLDRRLRLVVGHRDQRATSTSLTDVEGSGASRAASDNDICHIWMKTSHPRAHRGDPPLRRDQRERSIRSSSPAPRQRRPVVNTDAYVKAFRPNDYMQFVHARTAQVEAAEQARIYALRDRDSEIARLQRHPPDLGGGARHLRPGARAQLPDRPRLAPVVWASAQVGSSFRRGDFQRIGSTPDRDWGDGHRPHRLRAHDARLRRPDRHRRRRLVSHRRLRPRHGRTGRAAVRLPLHPLRPAHRRREQRLARAGRLRPPRLDPPADRRRPAALRRRRRAPADLPPRRLALRRLVLLRREHRRRRRVHRHLRRCRRRHRRHAPGRSLSTGPDRHRRRHHRPGAAAPGALGPDRRDAHRLRRSLPPRPRLLQQRRCARSLVGVRLHRSLSALRGADARRPPRPPGVRLLPRAALLPLPEPLGPARRRDRGAGALHARPARALGVLRSAPVAWSTSSPRTASSPPAAGRRTGSPKRSTRSSTALRSTATRRSTRPR